MPVEGTVRDINDFGKNLESLYVGEPKKELYLHDAELELDPDAWERFERAVGLVIKSGPKHRQRPHNERKERPPSNGAFTKDREGSHGRT